MSTAVPSNKWLIVLTVMMVAVVEVLDMTITNVALPHMMSSLSANSTQISWVLTAYIVAAAIFMPLTGFLAQLLGRRRLLLLNISGFCLASMLCGLAHNLPQIVFFRIAQGLFGASLVPLSQMIMRDLFSKAEQGKAMAIWGIGIMAGPILGPTLGGLITEHLSWRWIFFINIPICLIAYLMTWRLISETIREKIPIDWWGLLFMVCGIGSLQLFLDKGNEENWFDSLQIVGLLILSLFSLLCFVLHSLKQKKPLVNLTLFANRNYTISCLLMTVFGMSLFGSLAITPILLQELLHYPVSTAGFIMAPQAMASAVGMAIVSQIITKVDPRKIMSVGIVLAALGNYARSDFSLDSGATHFLYASIVQGLGIGMFFVPLTTLAFDTLEGRMAADGAGLFSFFRSIGSSIGISITMTLLSRHSQIHWQQLGDSINPSNTNLKLWLQQPVVINHPEASLPLLANELYRQSSMLAYVNTFWAISLITLALLPLVLLLQFSQRSKV